MTPVNVPNNTSKHSVKSTRGIQRPGQASSHLLQGLQLVNSAWYFRVNLHTQLIWSTHIYQAGIKTTLSPGILGPHLNERSGLPIRDCVLLYYEQLIPL